MHEKIPPLSPTPHPKPWKPLYLCEALQKRLWSEPIVYFHSMSSYACVRMEKPQNTPCGIGLMSQ